MKFGGIYYALHLSIHHNRNGGGFQQHPLALPIVDILQYIISSTPRFQGLKDGATVLVQLGIELQNVPPLRLLGAPIAVQRDAVILHDTVPVGNENTVGVLAQAYHLADLIQNPFPNQSAVPPCGKNPDEQKKSGFLQILIT